MQEHDHAPPGLRKYALQFPGGNAWITSAAGSGIENPEGTVRPETTSTTASTSSQRSSETARTRCVPSGSSTVPDAERTTRPSTKSETGSEVSSRRASPGPARA